jgi:hypothetical protein
VSDRNLEHLDSEIEGYAPDELDEDGLTEQERLAVEDDREVEDYQEEHQFDTEEDF